MHREDIAIDLLDSHLRNSRSRIERVKNPATGANGGQ